jgi:protein HOOK3
MELEADVKKIPGLQSTIEELQSQISLLEKDNESGGDTLKASAAEVAELRSRATAAEAAKKMFEEELKELRAQQESEVGLDDSPVKGLSLANEDSVSSEKTMRLEIENKALREEVEALKQKAAAQQVAAPAVAAPVEANDKTEELQAEVTRLTGELAEKEAEKAKISSDKDKLEAYTKRTLAKFQEKYLVALQECKAKLKEKQDKIEALENRSSSEKTAQKREERLLSSTVYELGLAIMQDRLKER